MTRIRVRGLAAAIGIATLFVVLTLQTLNIGRGAVRAVHAKPVTPEAATIVLTKTVGLDPNACAPLDFIQVIPGTDVTYCYEVQNTGTITVTEHTLEDSELGAILVDFPYGLLPGAQVFVTQTAQLTETTVNSATWTAANPGLAIKVSAFDTATVDVIPPSIILTKTVGFDPQQCASSDEVNAIPGTEVTYCYYVRNTGPIPLTKHTLLDNRLGSIFDDFAYGLPPDSSAFVTATATLTETTINTATWTALSPVYDLSAESADTATVNVTPPSIVLTKTVGLDPNVCASASDIDVLPATDVTYCYEVENTGPIELTSHDLVDDELGPLLTAFGYDLQPGATVWVTTTAPITETTVNTATWTAYLPGLGLSAEADDMALVNVKEPAITFAKTVGIEPGECANSDNVEVATGTEVTYCYAITNLSPVVMTNHTLVDDRLGILLDDALLDVSPGNSTYILASQIITETTINAATWTAVNPQFGATAEAGGMAIVTVMEEPVELLLLYLPAIYRN